MIESPIELSLRLFAGVVLLLMNGFFVTTEFALTRVRQFEKEDFEGSRGLEIAWNMLINWSCIYLVVK